MPRNFIWAMRLLAVVACVSIAPMATGRHHRQADGPGHQREEGTAARRQHPHRGPAPRRDHRRSGRVLHHRHPGRHVHRCTLNLVGYCGLHRRATSPSRRTSRPTLNVVLEDRGGADGGGAGRGRRGRCSRRTPPARRDSCRPTRSSRAADPWLPGRGGAADRRRELRAPDRQRDQNGNTLIIRGGRPNETAYYVDGFSQQDPLTGNATHLDQQQRDRGSRAAERRVQRRVRPHHVGRRSTSSRARAARSTSAASRRSPTTSTATATTWMGAQGLRLQRLRRLARRARSSRASDLGTFYYSGQRRWQGDRSAELPIFDATADATTR